MINNGFTPPLPPSRFSEKGFFNVPKKFFFTFSGCWRCLWENIRYLKRWKSGVYLRITRSTSGKWILFIYLFFLQADEIKIDIDIERFVYLSHRKYTRVNVILIRLFISGLFFQRFRFYDEMRRKKIFFFLHVFRKVFSSNLTRGWHFIYFVQAIVEIFINCILLENVMLMLIFLRSRTNYTEWFFFFFYANYYA